MLTSPDTQKGLLPRGARGKEAPGMNKEEHGSVVACEALEGSLP